MRIKCLNYLMKEKIKNSKDKGLVATLSDTKNDSSNEYMDEEKVKNLKVELS